MSSIDQSKEECLLVSGKEDKAGGKERPFDPEKTVDEPVELVREQLLQSGVLKPSADRSDQSEFSDSEYLEGEMPTVKLPRISVEAVKPVDDDEANLSSPPPEYLVFKKKFFDLTSADVNTNYGVLRGGKLRMDVESLQTVLFAALDEYFLQSEGKPHYRRIYHGLLSVAEQFVKLEPKFTDVLNDAGTALSWAQLRSGLVHPAIVCGDVKDRYPELVRKLANLDGLHLFDRGMYHVMNSGDEEMYLREGFGPFHIEIFAKIVSDDTIWQSAVARPLFEAITYALGEIERYSDTSLVELVKAMLYQKNRSLKPPSKVINNLLLSK